jgi:hypothetical protein
MRAVGLMQQAEKLLLDAVCARGCLWGCPAPAPDRQSPIQRTGAAGED